MELDHYSKASPCIFPCFHVFSGTLKQSAVLKHNVVFDKWLSMAGMTILALSVTAGARSILFSVIDPTLKQTFIFSQNYVQAL